MNLCQIRIKRFINKIYWKFFKYNHEDYVDYLNNKNWNYPTVKTVEDTINELLKTNNSITRYGDGEFVLCLGRSISFQKKDVKLRKRLREILQKPNNHNCLVAIVTFTPQNFTSYEKRFWFENVKDIIGLLNPKTTYFNASITRQSTIEQFLLIKEIWNDRNVIFVTGKGSRFDDNHELFSNIKTKEIIYSTAIDAWKNYDDLLQSVIALAKEKEDPIVICSLGPTASVLTFDLSANNIRALDLGHFTNVFDALKYDKQIPEKISERE